MYFRNAVQLLQHILIYAIQMATGEFVYRLVQLGREQKRSTASFAHKAHTILMPVSELTRASLLIAVVIACTLGCNSVEFRERLVSADGAAVCIVYALWRFVGLTESRLDTLDFIRAANGLDYGSGMALSYFYGYLRLILPALGDYESKSLRDRCDVYEDCQSAGATRQTVRIPVKKLFILAPDLMSIPNTLETDTLWKCTSLEPLVLNRAGCMKRVYHNSVYSMLASTEATVGGTGTGVARWYVVAEGATPLRTFYEVLRSAGASSGELERYRTEIVASFVQHLRLLLRDDEDCRDLCEVVTYADRTADGRVVDVGGVLRKAIERQLARDNESP